jgi:hypothetical protein
MRQAASGKGDGGHRPRRNFHKIVQVIAPSRAHHRANIFHRFNRWHGSMGLIVTGVTLTLLLQRTKSEQAPRIWLSVPCAIN